ncbi:hypothetical protein KZ483_15415 [Paenibacillus sp. sptzw28]|uniref:hypothetical protein n=1 Tax=Paenibacillus sp. sptzw28 TaxID=715179 RepID=UPI001C6DDFF1|nr:hypothetical protein [Paenibacillus sp. sptzw28]QYR19325.1 hypothetical protein KZ483_15415 [Paenibacillus sp. sptzw28]
MKIILSVLLFFVLTACSNSPHSGVSAAAHPKLGSASLEKLHPTRLTIERKGKLQSVKHQPPARYQVNDKKLTEEIYVNLLDSESVPKNVVISCPNDLGISYDMTFYENGKEVFLVNVDGGGCQFISVKGKDAYRTKDSFWKLMQEATGLNGAQLAGAIGSF